MMLWTIVAVGFVLVVVLLTIPVRVLWGLALLKLWALLFNREGERN